MKLHCDQLSINKAESASEDYLNAVLRSSEFARTSDAPFMLTESINELCDAVFPEEGSSIVQEDL